MEQKVSMWTSFFMDLSPEDALRELSRAGWLFGGAKNAAQARA